LETLQAELGQNIVQDIDLTLSPGSPDYNPSDPREYQLPLTLQGQVVFQNPNQIIGQESLIRILHQIFPDQNAVQLYLLRLRMAQDPTLKVVSTVRLQNQDHSTTHQGGSTTIATTTDDDEFLSNLFIAIVASVGAAIVAVTCFASCASCQAKTIAVLVLLAPRKYPNATAAEYQTRLFPRIEGTTAPNSPKLPTRVAASTRIPIGRHDVVEMPPPLLLLIRITSFRP
jgi:hypothetical protein